MIVNNGGRLLDVTEAVTPEGISFTVADAFSHAPIAQAIFKTHTTIHSMMTVTLMGGN